MLDFNLQYLVAEALAKTLKQHHEYRGVQHVGSRVFYQWKGNRIAVSFAEAPKTDA